jgi:hypothetical protein
MPRGRHAVETINHHQQEDRRRTTGEKVTAYFSRFGTGSENQSDFEVDVVWSDVERLINDFAAAGNTDAIRVRKAVELLSSLERALAN